MRRSLTFSCLTLVFASHIAVAKVFSSPQNVYYPKDFYQSIEDGTRDIPLKKMLFAILSQAHVQSSGDHDEIVSVCPIGKTCVRHSSLGYTAARRILFGKLHLEEHGNGYQIRDLYCQRLVGQTDFTANPPGPGQIPDPLILNAEHTWPQSRFSSRFDRNLQKSDLHILFPVASNANSSRGNGEFGDVVTPLSSPCPASRRGYGVRGGGKVFFEVPDSHKGNVARAIFYFSIRYDLRIKEDEEISLKAWHRADPVDQTEMIRNAAIHLEQNDRNPFIDYPELVELISDF